MTDTLAIANTTIDNWTLLECAVSTIISFIAHTEPRCRITYTLIVTGESSGRVGTVALGAINAMKVIKALAHKVLLSTFFYTLTLATAWRSELLGVSFSVRTLPHITSWTTPAWMARATSSHEIALTTHGCTLLSGHKLDIVYLVVGVPLTPHVGPLQWPVIVIPLALHTVAHEVRVE